jgi:hypothetical protein
LPQQPCSRARRRRDGGAGRGIGAVAMTQRCNERLITEQEFMTIA